MRTSRAHAFLIEDLTERLIYPILVHPAIPMVGQMMSLKQHLIGPEATLVSVWKMDMCRVAATMG